jgi:hypothetical protein
VETLAEVLSTACTCPGEEGEGEEEEEATCPACATSKRLYAVELPVLSCTTARGKNDRLAVLLKLSLLVADIHELATTVEAKAQVSLCLSLTYRQALRCLYFDFIRSQLCYRIKQ